MATTRIENVNQTETAEPATGPGRALAALDRPGDAFANIGPNWFAAVMGTGIVATASVTLPVASSALRGPATFVWLLAAALLVVLIAASVVHWVRYPSTARGHGADPIMAHFWGAPPMALLTVGAGTLLLGRDWIGLHAAIRVDSVLWAAGTALGLFTSVWVPYRMMTRIEASAGDAFGGWLMPVVPPMVSAATGALLVPYAPPGQFRLGLLFSCYAMFGLSLFAALALIPAIWARLMTHKTLPARMMPTSWIVLGPIGQSVTAAGSLGAVAPLALGAHRGDAASLVGLFYGIPTLGFGLLWFAIATALTVRTARSGMPFGLTWWAFTFPVGTMVTGASSLANHTGATLLKYVAVALYIFLVVAWAVVAVRTAAGVWRGELLRPPAPTPDAATQTASHVQTVGGTAR